MHNIILVQESIFFSMNVISAIARMGILLGAYIFIGCLISLGAIL